MRAQFLLLALCAVARVGAADTPASPLPAPAPPPCASPEAGQLDFWLGEWDASWPAQGATPAGTGTNHVESILGGCVVQETFVDKSPQALLGHSVSMWSPQKRQWQQTWVDNQGSYLDFVGEWKNGEMSFWRSARAADGSPVVTRMVFFAIKPDSFDWRWESSKDEGKTWKLLWPIHYARRSGTTRPRPAR
jgi:hypothetical protein